MQYIVPFFAMIFIKIITEYKKDAPKNDASKKLFCSQSGDYTAAITAKLQCADL